MTEYVIEMSDQLQRYRPEPVTRLTSDVCILLGRLNGYLKSERHLPNLGSYDPLKFWYSVYSEGGADAEMVEKIDAVLDCWSDFVSHDADYLKGLGTSRIQKGDRFILIGPGNHHSSVYALHSYAFNLAEELGNQILGSMIALNVLGFMYPRTQERHTRIIEALAHYRTEVTAIVSEPRLWLADGQIHFKKTRKLLSDKVSSSLGGLEEAELQALARLWRDTGTKILASSMSERGVAFESEVELFFRSCGFAVETTAKSGDFGVDLIVSDGEMRIAVQVKNLTAAVGVAAIQEVTAGAFHYRCSRKMVVANNGFSDAAAALATSTGTRLETLHSLRQHMRPYLLAYLMA
jgi:hypothetical protein